MKSKWTQNLDPKDTDNFKRIINASKPTLERLSEIVKEMVDDIDRSEENIQQLEKPNWYERQIFKNGQRASLKAILNLIDLDQKVDK